jgi:hypothetical protein
MGQYQNRGDHEFCLDLIRSRDMAEVERTFAGLQTIIPGCERRTLPKSTTPVDESGQGLLHFCKPPTLREKLEARSDVPLRPARGQKALPKSGLFVSSEFDCEPSIVRRHPD